MPESRDTQFAGFGKAVIKHMLDHHGGWIDFNEDNPEEIEAYSTLIARRAYDLVEHALDACDLLEANAGLESHGFTSDYLLSHIPDLTTWPEEAK